MEILHTLVGYVVHFDKHMSAMIEHFGAWSYGLIFIVIFCETGLVVTPFLPGDSLLFAAGTFAALGSFNIGTLFVLVFVAAVAGDSVNYAIGSLFGRRMIERHSRFVKPEYIDRTHRFFEKHGGKTIVLARFVPIVRTFAPFVAGLGNMSYGRFFLYNVGGGLLWTVIFVLGGYFFGNTPLIKENFSLAILVIIVVSVLPAAIEIWKHRKQKSG